MCSITFDWEENDAMEKVKRFEKDRKGWFGDLLWITAEFTELCNHKCIYCYESTGPRKDYKIVEKDLMEKMIDYLSEEGIKQLTCSGGEPLLYPFIKDAVKLAKDRGMIVHMITNGYFLTKKRARELYDAGLSQVQINIDSVEHDKHDMFRGKKGSFRHAVQALKNAKESGMTCVTQTVLTKLNENEVINVFRFARNLGIQRCRVWDIVPSQGRALGNMHLKPSNNYIETASKITEFAKETGAVNIESGDPLFHSDVEKRLPVTGGYCPYSIGLLANLSVEGDSYFCCAYRENPMYNIFDVMKKGENLKKVHKKALEVFLGNKQMFNLPDECKNCSSLKTCKGGCHVRRGFNNGNDYWCQKLDTGNSGTYTASASAAPMQNIRS
jgi:radical SAM protein with 4Fe4S-binding SPASM domain